MPALQDSLATMLQLYALAAPNSFHPALLLAPVLPPLLAQSGDDVAQAEALQACHSAVAAAAAAQCPALSAETMHGVQEVMVSAHGSPALHALHSQLQSEHVRHS